jgi:hypothetical protein
LQGSTLKKDVWQGMETDFLISIKDDKPNDAAIRSLRNVWPLGEFGPMCFLLKPEEKKEY